MLLKSHFEYLEKRSNSYENRDWIPPVVMFGLILQPNFTSSYIVINYEIKCIFDQNKITQWWN